MKIVVITQDDPFYLGPNLEYLIEKLPDYASIVACVVTQVSPFGRRESFLTKGLNTLRIFGMRFFFRYAVRFLIAKIRKNNSVPTVLARHRVPMLTLTSSINNGESLAQIRSYNPDILISIAGNEIFKRPLIDLAPHGCLNLHTSLLPKYRGLMPSFWVLKKGETETGVSVFFVDEGIDSGPIVVQKSLRITGLTQEELIRKTKRLGMEAVIEAIDNIRCGQVELIENHDEEKTYFSFPTKQDVREFRQRGARFF